MGAIQNSITGALGAVAGAAVAGKHLKDVKAKEEEQGLLAKEQYHEAAADLTRLSGEYNAAGKAVEETSAAYDAAMAKRPGGKGNTKAAIAERQKKALTEKEAALKAEDTKLNNRISKFAPVISGTEPQGTETGHVWLELV